MATETLRYPFSARPLPMLMAVLFFGGAAGFFAHLFLHSDKPVRVLFFLVEGGATKVLFAGLGLCSLGFVVAGVGAFVRDKLQPRELVIDGDALRLPLGMVQRTVHEVRLADIRAVGLTTIYNNRFIVVQHAGGTLQFPAGHLPDDTAVKAVLERLRAG